LDVGYEDGVEYCYGEEFTDDRRCLSMLPFDFEN